MTTTVKQEQGGVSALAAIEYLTPIVKDLLDNGEKPDDTLAKLGKLPDDELFLLGHRFGVLHQITDIVLTLLATQAASRVLTKRPTDPRLS